ncbi:TraR/DksA C4-type zinc finger protein [Dickeya fangzhongdai]|uniref:TraR/DksA C4-type zinc finger protein n=1 Tax=Dickeya fangzhongdai TaxID=1778540 RepID=UPI00136A64F7|nr:TraR/DksA C4-type zinc finger protein [Dickeya fangzhongdai]UMB78835.1 TraR/DksA C4-type zinc finger protein [Dickeya fangzhongdai]
MADTADDASELEHFHREAALSLARINRNAISAIECKECGEIIGEARRQAYPGCTLCISCKTLAEARARHRKG